MDTLIEWFKIRFGLRVALNSRQNKVHVKLNASIVVIVNQ